MSLVDAKVSVSNTKDNIGIVELDKPEYGVAPGQACVFYNRQKKMIGGGWISASEKKISQINHNLLYEHKIKNKRDFTNYKI